MAEEKARPLRIVIPVFDDVELLDVTGPAEMLGNMGPQTPEIYLVADKPVYTYPHNANTPFYLTPNADFASCPRGDVLMVPGGSGQTKKMFDLEFLEFLRFQAGPPVEEGEEPSNWVTSVCTGALLLGAAGLLNGYLATTHWDSLSALNAFPEVLVAGGYPRYVICGNRITSGGVSSGIDMALALVAVLQNEEAAKVVQMYTQYDPDPPFVSGNPAVATPHAMATAAKGVDSLRATRVRQVEEIVASWCD